MFATEQAAFRDRFREDGGEIREVERPLGYHPGCLQIHEVVQLRGPWSGIYFAGSALSERRSAT